MAAPPMSPGDITILLSKLREGDREAESRLLALVYDELRRIAAARMKGERSGHTLQTTAVVHETYIRLLQQTEIEWLDRVHFFAIAARTMRRVLVDYARTRAAQKRGGGALVMSFVDGLVFTDERCGQLVDLDDALTALALQEERVSHVIELRFFAGLSFEETAAILNVSVRTAKRDWEFGRAWLRSELEPNP